MSRGENLRRMIRWDIHSITTKLGRERNGFDAVKG